MTAKHRWFRNVSLAIGFSNKLKRKTISAGHPNIFLGQYGTVNIFICHITLPVSDTISKPFWLILPFVNINT